MSSCAELRIALSEGPSPCAGQATLQDALVRLNSHSTTLAGDGGVKEALFECIVYSHRDVKKMRLRLWEYTSTSGPCFVTR